MKRPLNQEVVNDTAKLIMHRLIARELASQPDLITSARAHHARISARFPDREFVRDWDGLLVLTVEELRQRIVRRDQRMRQLRISSPLVVVERFNFSDVRLRRRIGQAARRIATRAAHRAAQTGMDYVR